MASPPPPQSPPSPAMGAHREDAGGAAAEDDVAGVAGDAAVATLEETGDPGRDPQGPVLVVVAPWGQGWERSRASRIPQGRNLLMTPPLP